MYPLKDWEKLKRGFRFKDIYPASFGILAGKPHLGLDLMVPIGTPLYAPESGLALQHIDPEVGNAIYFQGSKLIRMMHLSKYEKTGFVQEGDLIGYTGNSGMSTGPHLHIDVSKGKLNIYDVNSFIDPEIYFMRKPITIRILSSVEYDWQPAKDWLVKHNIPIYLTTSNYDGQAQWKQYTSDEDRVDEDWMDSLCSTTQNADVVMTIVDNWTTPDGILGYSRTEQRLGQFRGYISGATQGSHVTILGADYRPVQLNIFLHELCHILYQGTKSPDRTHELDYGGKPDELLSGVNVEALPRFKLDGAKRLFKKINGKVQEKDVTDATANLFASGYNYWLTKFGWSETIPQ